MKQIEPFIITITLKMFRLFVFFQKKPFCLKFKLIRNLLGYNVLHTLTLRMKYELRVDLEKFPGANGYAKYSTFAVWSESQKYKLTVTGYEGDAGMRKW